MQPNETASPAVVPFPAKLARPGSRNLSVRDPRVWGARFAIACLLILGVAGVSMCRSTGSGKDDGKTGKTGEPNGKKTSDPGDTGKKSGGSETEITAEMRQNGFVSANSYQVFVTAFGSTEAEARESGLTEGRRKALNLMKTDPALAGKRLSAEASEELRRLVQNSSRIVRIQREPNGSWSVVVHVEKEGLKGFLRRL